MALSKTITVTQQYQNNATSPVAVSFAAQPMVQDGRLVPDILTANPGVFSNEQPRSGTPSFPPMNSNA